MFKLDRTDRKILKVLGKDARLSQNQIGKLIKTSRDVIQYRVNKLEKKGIIKQYIASINNHVFGIENYLITIKLQHLSKKTEENMLSRLKKVEYVRFLAKCRGDYDIMMVVGAKNKLHLGQVVTFISNICGKHMRSLDLCVYIKMLKYDTHDYLLDDFSYEPKRQKGKAMELDHKDKKMVKLLSENARMPIIELAPKIRLTAETTSERLKKLVKNNIITGTQATIDLNKIGLQQYIVFLKLNHFTRKRELSIRELMSQIKTINHADRLLGAWDLRFNVIAENHTQFLSTLDQIREFFGKDISDYSFTLAIEEIKRKTYVGS